VYQKLREDIDDAFDKMGPIHPLPFGNSKKGKQVISSTGMRPDAMPQLLKHKLEITVRKLNQAHFSIVDIPGFVSSKFVSSNLLRQVNFTFDGHLACSELTQSQAERQ
jgi:hypothetical protein